MISLVHAHHEPLDTLLERHRSALHALPGVVGTGIGFRSPEQPEGDIVIQVFVRSEAVADDVAERAAALIPPDRLAVIVSGDATPLGGAP